MHERDAPRRRGDSELDLCRSVSVGVGDGDARDDELRVLLDGQGRGRHDERERIDHRLDHDGHAPRRHERGLGGARALVVDPAGAGELESERERLQGQADTLADDILSSQAEEFADELNEEL